MSQEVEILTKLKKQLVAFLDELIEFFPKEADFVIFRIFIKDQLPIGDIMNYIVESLCPYEKFVAERDGNLFLDKNVLFEKFDSKKMNKVNHFKNLWTSKEVDDKDRENIWRWFELFISLGKKYKEIKSTR